MNNGLFIHTIRCISGFLFSILFIWLISYCFLDTIPTYEFDPQLDRYINTPGSIHRHRSEGWAITKIGKYGIMGISDITKVNNPKVAFWGDSYVEGFNIDDDKKMEHIFTNLCRSNDNMKDIVGFGIGNSYDNIANYYFGIPKYEKIIPGIIAHYLIITNIKDILPDLGERRSVFTSKPVYQFINIDWKPPGLAIRNILRKYELSFLWDILKAMKGINLRFIPGPLSSSDLTGEESPEIDEPSSLWSFVTEKISDQTNLPITIVYCPMVPKIENGATIYAEKDKYASMWRAFAEQCKKNNIDVIDMSNIFIEYYRNTGHLPRGFPNSFPGEGHMNADGHRLVAETIFNYMRNMRLR